MPIFRPKRLYPLQVVLFCSWGPGNETNDRAKSNMAAVIQRLSRQALVTFMTRETAAFSSNFERLKTMVSQMITVLNLKYLFLGRLRFLKGVHAETHAREMRCVNFTVMIEPVKLSNSALTLYKLYDLVNS